MKSLKKTFLLFIAISLTMFGTASAKVLYQLDFSSQKDGSALKWMKSQGFKLERDADEMNPRFKNGTLYFETKDDILGLFSWEKKIEGAKKVRIEWGVNKYPDGADWEKKVYREAISLVMTFGTKKIDSGSWVVPSVPYFISLFLGEKEKEGKSYVGNYYTKGGRYFCTPCKNPLNSTVVTEFAIPENFKSEFKQSSVPAITALAIEIDTRDTKGPSMAFIKKIEFLD